MTESPVTEYHVTYRYLDSENKSVAGQPNPLTGYALYTEGPFSIREEAVEKSEYCAGFQGISCVKVVRVNKQKQKK